MDGDVAAKLLMGYQTSPLPARFWLPMLVLTGPPANGNRNGSACVCSSSRVG
jgi:hypothetical protein